MRTESLYITAVFSLHLVYSTETTTQGQSCRGVQLSATAQPQYLQSPGYPVAYKNYEDCQWTITVSTSSEKIKIVVVSSHLEYQSTCNYDSVKVYDGRNTSFPLIKTWCGSQTPTVVSTRSSMTLRFQTDSSNVYRGFKLKYFQTGGCGGNLTAYSSSTFLTSPGYPGNYSNNQICIWTITTASTEANMKVKIIVMSSQLEDEADCQYDSVKVYNGMNTLSPLIQTWCGVMTPTATSSGRYMTLRFKTDSSNVYRGFKLNYYQAVDSHSCGGNLTASNSETFLTSPGYPQNYSNNLDCVWTIKTASNEPLMMVKIVVVSSQLENQTTCLYDFVKVYDGVNTLSPLIQTWCGVMTPTVTSSGRYMTLRFKTDSSNVYGGFKLLYTQIMSVFNCGDHLTVDSVGTIITSPRYPNNYPNNMDCAWTIKTVYKFIKIKVLQSDIEESNLCSYDRVKVLDGSPMVLGTFCGSQTPTYFSTGNDVTIIFHSDNSNTAKGFKLKATGVFFTPCGQQNVDAYSFKRYLTSPNYPNNYQSNTYCIWRIDAGPDGFAVSLKVVTSSIEYSLLCDNDYVEAFDGYNDSAPSLGRWCGSDTPSKQSSGRYMFLRFKTDGSNTDTGFNMSYVYVLQNTGPHSRYVNVGAVVGGVIGGVAFTVVVAISIVIVIKKNSRRLEAPMPFHDTRVSSSIPTVSQRPDETAFTPAPGQPYQAQPGPGTGQPYEPQPGPGMGQPYQDQPGPGMGQPYQPQPGSGMGQPYQAQPGPGMGQPYQPQPVPWMGQPYQPQPGPAPGPPYQPQSNPMVNHVAAGLGTTPQMSYINSGYQ